MIELKEVSVKNGKEEAARKVSARLVNGRVYGIVSERTGDGARLLGAMAGAIPYAGQIKINGYDLRKQPKKARACLGYLPEGAPVYGSLTAVEALETVAAAKGIAYERAIRRIHEILGLTGLEEIKNKQASSMEEVDRRLLSIAQAMMGDGDVLLLTDPLKGLTEREAEEVADVLAELKKNRTLFVCSDAMEGLPENIDTVLLLRDGELIESPDAELLEPLRKRRADSPSDQRASRKPRTDGKYEVIGEDE